MHWAWTSVGLVLRRRYVVGLALLVGWIGVTAGALSAVDLYMARQTASSAQETLTIARYLTAGVSQQVQRTVDGIAALHRLGAILMLSTSNDDDDGDVDDQIRWHLAEVARTGQLGVLQVALVAPDGLLRWSTVPDAVPVDLSDREHVRVHLQGQQAPHIFISEPVLGRVSGRWSIQVSAPVIGEGGRLTGIVVVSLDPNVLASELRTLQFVEGGVVTLLRSDGVVLARSDDSSQFLGARIAPDQHAILAAAPSGTGRVASSLTQASFYVAWQTLAPLPLIAVVGLPTSLSDNGLADDRRVLQILAVSLSSLGALAVSLSMALAWRRRAQLAAARSEERQRELSELLDALPGAAYRALIRAEGGVLQLQFGAAIGRILDLEGPPPFYGDVLSGALSSTDRAASAAMFLDVVHCGAGAIEYEVICASGMRRWLRDDCRRVRIESDGTAALVGTVTDITDERSMKAKALSAANLATLGEMATGIAHELSQPSATIALAADVAALSLEKLGAEGVGVARARLNRIAEHAVRIRGIIDHLRIFGRVDDGALVPVRLSEVIEGATRIVGGTLRASCVELSVRASPDLPPVRGRLIPLEQVLVNLLLNARDAMADASSDVRFAEIAAELDSDGTAVVVAVRDRGTGVDPSIAHRVFEPFFTTKSAGQGTGLGLAITYGTVTGYGGSITLRNRPDPPGAEVVLSLPVWQDPHPETQSKNLPERAC